MLRPPLSTLFPYTTLFRSQCHDAGCPRRDVVLVRHHDDRLDRKSTRLNSSHGSISYAVFCLKKKKKRRSALTLTLTAALTAKPDGEWIFWPTGTCEPGIIR